MDRLSRSNSEKELTSDELFEDLNSVVDCLEQSLKDDKHETFVLKNDKKCAEPVNSDADNIEFPPNLSAEGEERKQFNRDNIDVPEKLENCNCDCRLEIRTTLAPAENSRNQAEYANNCPDCEIQDNNCMTMSSDFHKAEKNDSMKIIEIGGKEKNNIEPCSLVNRCPSVSDGSSSRTSLESLQEDSDDTSFLNKDKLELTNHRHKSCSMLSSMSEREFVLNYGKEKQLSQLSLERDKNPPVFSGYLSKLGGTGFTPKNWRKRWFVLRNDNCLYYYKNPKESPVGAVVLANYLVTTLLTKTNKKYTFHLTKGGARSYTFAAASEMEKKTWMKVISEAAKSSQTVPASPESSIHNVSIPALSIKDPDCHGYLWKQGYSHKSWKKRYSVLKSGCLYYYQDMSETVALGVFNMHCYRVHETELAGRKNSFIAIPPQPAMRTYYFSAETEHDRERWLKAMEQSIEKARTDE